ncbi:hypothetical protein [Pelagibacterium lacus]|uniref:PepSY domain-containing protein n=1 Tax=Pelagibacterium lacus TaxID=2282655 RepID=A0A369WAP1_9HYPH|nr:hypothetical protein [Pelagibacterium lacus]RDE10460.1 hypothetical protein DVH29_00460 [Pelagibacterium lacus]
MKTSLLSRLTSLALALCLFLPLGVAPGMAQGQCWDNAAIQAALDQGQIRPVAAVLAREGVNPATEVLSVRVCDQGSGPVYVLAVLGPGGEARNLTLSAR